MTTFIESLFDRAVATNSPVVPVDGTCDLVIISGPTRLASESPEAFKSLAMTALQGYATKEIVNAGVPSPVADITPSQSASTKNVGVLVTISGAPVSFRCGPITLAFTYASGGTATSVVCYPKTHRCQYLLVTTNDNGGVGQVAAVTDVTATWTAANHPNTAVFEFNVALESVNLRDFTSRMSR